jgi:anti-sigma factor RsiW
MANCPQVDSLITPYVDGEASPSERHEVETHLDRCPPCQRQAQAESTARTLLRTRAESLPGHASPRLHERCRLTASELTASGGAARQPRRWSRRLAMAAVVLLSLAGAVGYGVVFYPAEAMAAQLTLDHLKCFALAGDSGTTTPAEVRTALRSRYGWDVPVPEPAAAGDLRIVGGRRCIVLDGSLAHVLYRRGLVPVSVFVLPAGVKFEGRFEILGHTAVMFPRGESTIVVLARDMPDNVERVAEVFGKRIY